MAWSQLELTNTHVSILLISTFLIIYSLFSLFIRNRLYLSEPPLATLIGVVFGPRVLGVVDTVKWGIGDDFTQEFTRIILGVQCLTIGIELPRFFFRKEWRSLAMLLGPIMTFGWLICAGFIYAIFDTGFPTALVISACLTPTDPILAASILSDSQFSERVPLRIRNILSAESGSNDGASFPFLYVGLVILQGSTTGEMLGRWFTITFLWQCVFGVFLGLVIGQTAYVLLRVADERRLIATESYLVFWLLLALFCVGVASTLGTDDFLVCFAAGSVFAQRGWFAESTKQSHLPNVIDLQLNTCVFIYFGARIPWEKFYTTNEAYPYLTPWRLFGFLILVLLFRRLPIILALKPLIPCLRTYREALFVGHFGPMGVGALFLAIEARAQLETDTSLPLPFPPFDLPPHRQRAVDLLWPIVCFVVLGSIVVHGLSTLMISIASHYGRKEGERAPLLGGETDGLGSMVHEEDEE